MQGLELGVLLLALLVGHESEATDNGKDDDGNTSLGAGHKTTTAGILGLEVGFSLVDLLVLLEVEGIVEGAHGLNLISSVLIHLELVVEVVVVGFSLRLLLLLSLFLFRLVVVAAGVKGDALNFHDILADLVGLVLILLVLILLLLLAVLVPLVELREGLAVDSVPGGGDNGAHGVDLSGGEGGHNLSVIVLVFVAVIVVVVAVVADVLVVAGNDAVVVEGGVVDGAVIVKEEADLGAAGLPLVLGAADEASIELDTSLGVDACAGALRDLVDVLGEVIVVVDDSLLLLLLIFLFLLTGGAAI